MSSSRSITRGYLGSPIVSRCQLVVSQRYNSLPNGSITIEVISETPTEITELPLVPLPILNSRTQGAYSNIISPSLEVIDRFDKGCRESRKPEKEGGDLSISFLSAETE